MPVVMNSCQSTVSDIGLSIYYYLANLASERILQRLIECRLCTMHSVAIKSCFRNAKAVSAKTAVSGV